MNTLLEAEHLTKVFAQRGKEPFKAVDDVSFSLQAGERHYEIKTEPVKGCIWKYPDGFSESDRFL